MLIAVIEVFFTCLNMSGAHNYAARMHYWSTSLPYPNIPVDAHKARGMLYFKNDSLVKPYHKYVTQGQSKVCDSLERR